MEDLESYIYGKNAINEAIASGKPIEKIYISYGLESDFTEKIIIKNPIFSISFSKIRDKSVDLPRF